MSLILNRLSRLGRRAFSPEIIDASGIVDPRAKRTDHDAKKGGDGPKENIKGYVEEILRTRPEVRRGIKKRASFAGDGINPESTVVELDELVDSTARLIFSDRVMFPLRCGFDKYARGWSKWRLIFDERAWRLVDIVPIPEASPKKTPAGLMWEYNGQTLHPLEVIVVRAVDDPRSKHYEGVLEASEDVAIEEKARTAIVNSLMLKRGQSGTIVLIKDDSRGRVKIDPLRGPLEPDVDDPGDDPDALESGIHGSKWSIGAMMRKVGQVGINPKPFMQRWSSSGSNNVEPKIIHMPSHTIESELKAARQSLRRLVALTEVPLALLGMEEEVNAKGTLLVELLDFMHVVAVDRRAMGRTILQIITRAALVAGYDLEPGDITISFSKLGTFTSMIGREVQQQLATAYKYLMETGTVDPVWALQRIYDIPYEDAQQAVIGQPGMSQQAVSSFVEDAIRRRGVEEMSRTIVLDDAAITEAYALYEDAVG